MFNEDVEVTGWLPFGHVNVPTALPAPSADTAVLALPPAAMDPEALSSPSVVDDHDSV
jgi:hypothetical protein